ncbi:hypothetical protein [Desulfococcus sp.]|uniref:hypothetical protein n=1 Tax=Desulfococcus sp. TaxID=2025834 RepID=UPI003593F62C
MTIRGAGGTSGGIGKFFIGMAMMIGGGYLFLDAVRITHHLHLGYAVFSFGAFRLTTGMTLIPLIFGVGMIFYNAGNPLGWILSAATLIMLLLGVLSTIQFRIRGMSAFELIMILALFAGGAGLFLNSLKNTEK